MRQNRPPLFKPSASELPRGRFVELDALRGIAAVSVVLYHFTFLYSEYFPGLGQQWATFSWGYYGVHLFFFISGFVILMTARRYSAPKSFAIARATRLFPVYWVCLTLTVAMTAITGPSQLVPSLPQWLANYTMLQKFLRIREVDGSYWSLAVELIFYAAIIGLLILWDRPSTRSVIIFALAWLTLAGLAAALLPDVGGMRFVRFLIVSNYAHFFVAGMLAFLARNHDIPWVAPALMLPYGVAIGWVIGSAMEAIATIIILSVALFVSWAPQVPILRTRWLVWLGTISYPLYLLHQNIGYGMLSRLNGNLPWPISVAFTFSLILTMAWMVHEVVEKRIGRWLRGGTQSSTKRENRKP